MLTFLATTLRDRNNYTGLLFFTSKNTLYKKKKYKLDTLQVCNTEEHSKHILKQLMHFIYQYHSIGTFSVCHC